MHAELGGLSISKAVSTVTLAAVDSRPQKQLTFLVLILYVAYASPLVL